MGSYFVNVYEIFYNTDYGPRVVCRLETPDKEQVAKKKENLEKLYNRDLCIRKYEKEIKFKEREYTYL